MVKQDDAKINMKDNIKKLEDNIIELNKDIDFNASSFFPNPDTLPTIILEKHDYEQDLEKIKTESKETLDCLASLYISDKIMNLKNIHNIIINDSLNLTDLKFSIEVAKRGLINLMNQIESGISDPEMYMAVSAFQKEIRDSVKAYYELQKKMKEFYKELKDELQDINTGEDVKSEEIDTNVRLIEDSELNKYIENFLKNKK